MSEKLTMTGKLGIILQFAGFNGEAAVQSETALLWIEKGKTIKIKTSGSMARKSFCF